MSPTTDQEASLRYAALRHEGVSEPHFDILFEPQSGRPLITFRSDQWPIIERVKIERLPDHRQVYLEYEGPISGNRGSVKRVEAGTYLASAPWATATEPIHLTLLPSGRQLRIVIGGADSERWIEPA